MIMIGTVIVTIGTRYLIMKSDGSIYEALDWSMLPVTLLLLLGSTSNYIDAEFAGINDSSVSDSSGNPSNIL
jgi:hypothetical protein